MPTTTDETIRLNLIKFMKERGFNNPQLADRSNIPVGTLQKYVTGARLIKPAVMAAFAEALKVEPGYFFMENPPTLKPFEEPAVRFKVGPNAHPDIIEKARRYERELNKEQMDLVHAAKRANRDKKPPK